MKGTSSEKTFWFYARGTAGGPGRRCPVRRGPAAGVRGGRERAAQTACLSNLRQLHLAVTQYASDHDSLVPPYGTDFGGGFGDTVTKAEERDTAQAPELTAALAPYIKGSAIWFCPSDGFARTASKAGFVNHLYTSYKTGHNWYAIGGGPLPVLGRTAIDRPDLGPWQGKGEAVLLTNGLWNCVTPVGPLGSPEVPPDYSHRGRYNAILFDGHAVSFRRDQSSCVGQD